MNPDLEHLYDLAEIATYSDAAREELAKAVTPGMVMWLINRITLLEDDVTGFHGLLELED